MGADSSEGQKHGTFAPTDLIVVPAGGGNRQSVADFTYTSPDGWTARGRLGSGPDGLYLQTITVEAAAGQRVTAKALRDVPLTQIIASAQRTDFIIEASLALVSETLPPGEAADTKGPGRTPLSDTLLRDVALGYLEETAPGKGRGAVKRLADQMGVDTKTMSRYVFRARQTGWLGPAVQGREGAIPGRRLLQEWDAQRNPADRKLARRLVEGIDALTEAEATRYKAPKPDGE